MLSLEANVIGEWEHTLEQADHGLALRLLPVNLRVR